MAQKIKSIALRTLTLVVLALFLCSSALAAVPAYVNCSSLIVRSAPSKSGKNLGKLKKGTKLSVVAVKGSWAKVSYKGRTGFTAVKYLSKTSSKKSSSSTSKTTKIKKTKGYTTKKVAIYKKASTSSAKLGTVKAGTTVYVVGQNGSYYKVQNSSGSVTGFVKKNVLTKKKPSSGSKSESSSKATTKTDKLISLAKSLQGSTYSEGAKGSSKFDCSGFTYYCYKKIGVNLSRSAQSQGYNNGSKISSASNLRTGDIVCFNTNPNDSDLCDHVGIYLGSGKFVHASSAAGKVIISSMSSGYYKENFSWGRRVM